MHNLAEYAGVALLAALKSGVAYVVAWGFAWSWLERWLVPLVGSAAGTTVYLYLGQAIRRCVQWLRRRRNPTVAHSVARPPGRLQTLARRYGIWGVAVLTPPLLSPPVGAALCTALGIPRPRALRFLLISLTLWALAFALLGSLPWVKSIRELIN